MRFYEYENGLTYNARVLPYYNEGGRSFLLLRYKGIRKLTLEARVAQTRYFDGRTFGTGLEATGKTWRTEVGGAGDLAVVMGGSSKAAEGSPR